MLRLLLALVLFIPSSAQAFSYATGGCASGGCSNTPGEQWLSTNADEIDTALDAVESTNTTQDSTISSIQSNYMPKAGGTFTGSIDIGSGVNFTVSSGAQLLVGPGGTLGPSGGGTVLASAMSATGQIDDNDLAAGAVDGGTGGEIADGSITAADISDGSVTGTDILNDTVALTTDTSGDYVATVTGDSEITVSGAGTEGRAVTLLIDSTLTRDTELTAKSAASSTLTAIPKFSDTLGDLVDTGVTIADTTNSITTPGALSAGGSTGASTFTLRNMADSGWVECGVSGTTFTCAVDADGVPDGTL